MRKDATMDNAPLSQGSSPFDRIKRLENGMEYWSARDLQALLDYKLWQNFEKTIERAMISCKVAGHEVEDHFIEVNKMVQLGSGSRRKVKDYRLTRFACYSIAMNGDVEKPSIAQAQTYFAIKTREAELIQQQRLSPSYQQASIHALTDAIRPRALENLANVPDGYFSVMGELFKHLYNLEAIINQAIDDKAMIEISVGMHWSAYARDVLGIPDETRRKYPPRCQDGRIVHAWAYPMHYANTFAVWLWQDYFPKNFPAYQRYRAGRRALPAPRYQ